MELSSDKTLEQIGDAKDLVNEKKKVTQYFFKKIKTVYGPFKYERTWPTRGDEIAAHIEWHPRISEHTYEEVDHMFETVKRLMKDDDWPSINYILRINKYVPMHAPQIKIGKIDTPEMVQRRLEKLQEVKKRFGLTTRFDITK